MAGPHILGQLLVAGGTNGSPTDVYTSPSGGGGTAISTVAIINSTSASLAVTALSVVPFGATVSAVHTLQPGTTIAARDALLLTIGISLGPGERINVTAATGIAVHVYGTEL